MVAISPSSTRLGSNALRKKLVREHHEGYLGFERYIEIMT